MPIQITTVSRAEQLIRAGELETVLRNIEREMLQLAREIDRAQRLRGLILEHGGVLGSLQMTRELAK